MIGRVTAAAAAAMAGGEREAGRDGPRRTADF